MNFFIEMSILIPSYAALIFFTANYIAKNTIKKSREMLMQNSKDIVNLKKEATNLDILSRFVTLELEPEITQNSKDITTIKAELARLGVWKNPGLKKQTANSKKEL